MCVLDTPAGARLVTFDVDRPRRIVRLAASEETSASEWLRLDERGTWERRAAELLASTAAKAAELGMEPAAVDGEIATRLRYEALTALLADAKKRKVAR